jgi:hypothetical protein
MQAVPFLQQLLFAFLVLRVRDASINRANLGTLWRLMVSNTLGTPIGIDYVAGFSLRDSIVFALSFTRSAAYAVISDFVRHLSLSYIFILFGKSDIPRSHYVQL